MVCKEKISKRTYNIIELRNLLIDFDRNKKKQFLPSATRLTEIFKKKKEKSYEKKLLIAMMKKKL